MDLFNALYDVIYSPDVDNTSVMTLLKLCKDEGIFTASNKVDETLLSLCCSLRKRSECAEYIAKRCKEAASICDEGSWYPLHYEVRFGGTLESVTALLEAYPDAINKKVDESGVLCMSTPLLLALMDEVTLGVPTLLVEHGAELTKWVVYRLKEISEGRTYEKNTQECKDECAALLKRVAL